MSWYWPLLCRITALPSFCTWLPRNWTLYIADVECPVLFSILTVPCVMCNIALVAFLWLQYWSAWLIKICEHRKTCIFCVLSLVKPTKTSWNLLKIWSWNFTSCSWEPCNPYWRCGGCRVVLVCSCIFCGLLLFSVVCPSTCVILVCWCLLFSVVWRAAAGVQGRSGRSCCLACVK